jgi:pantoate--beta-alanine ligase
MQVIRDPHGYQRECERARAAGHTVGLVPTMGALHAGHLELVRTAAARTDFVTVSIFVNPTQFGQGEDLDRYPRTLDADREQCERAGAAVVFAPAPEAMYPIGDETRVAVKATAAALCGAHRPGHFEGVATVVTKLFVLAGRCTAVFGRKDYQQLRVIHRLVRDLFLPVKLVGVPTVREPDGLALSSRNAYLSSAERQRALAIPEALSQAVRAFEAGERRPDRLVATVESTLTEATDRIDYVELADPDSVALLPDDEPVSGRALLAVAAHVGKTRLIDNVVLGEDPAPLPE